jgi:hypothetical protein
MILSGQILLAPAGLVFEFERFELILELIDQCPHFLDATGPCPLLSLPAADGCILSPARTYQDIVRTGRRAHIRADLSSSLSFNAAATHVARCLSACGAVGRSDVGTG